MEKLPTIEVLLARVASESLATRYYAKHVLADKFPKEDRILETILSSGNPPNAEDLWNECFLLSNQPISHRGAGLLFPILDRAFRSKDKKNAFCARFLLQVPASTLLTWKSLLPQWRYLGAYTKELIVLKCELEGLSTPEVWKLFRDTAERAVDCYLGEPLIERLEIISRTLSSREDFRTDSLWEVIPSREADPELSGEGGYAELFALKIGTLKGDADVRKLVIPYYLNRHAGDYADLATDFSATASLSELVELFDVYHRADADERWDLMCFFGAIWNAEAIDDWRNLIDEEEANDLFTMHCSYLSEIPLRSNFEFITEAVQEGEWDETICDLREDAGLLGNFLDLDFPEREEWLNLFLEEQKKIGHADIRHRGAEPHLTA